MRSVYNVIVITILSCTLFTDIQAQSRYMEDNQNGFRIGLGIGDNQHVSSSALGVGFGIKGRTDIGINLGSIRPKEEGFEDVEATFVAPWISYTVLRADENVPIGLFLFGSYEKAVYKGGAFDFLNLEIDVSAVVLGMGVYSKRRLGSNFWIYPGLGIAYVYTEAEATLEVDLWRPVTFQGTTDDQTVAIALDVDLQTHISQRSSLVFSFGVNIREDVSTFKVQIAFLTGFLHN